MISTTARSLSIVFFMTAIAATVGAGTFPIVDTNQSLCYDEGGNVITCPATGASYCGQDAQHQGNQPSYAIDAANKTVIDLRTGLMWQQEVNPKVTWAEAVADAPSVTTGGFYDWRLPTLKELYSLIDFSGSTGMSAAESVPYIDTSVFDFAYGDEASGERFIDSQWVTSTDYVWTTMNGDETMFGVNFADGRIKGYGKEDPQGGGGKLFYVRYVRDESSSNYAVNDFLDNGDDTITDQATGLMWSRLDSDSGMNWQDALAWAEQKNTENHLGFDDWRLPNAKELQGIVDYTRSPDTHGTAAIDPRFDTSTLSDGEIPYFWTSTTHLDGPPQSQGDYAVYVTFGRAQGFMEMPPDSGNYQLLDVHGAGAQRSDPKTGDPADFPYGHGPQGDVVRIFNYVRLVRDVSDTSLFVDGFESGNTASWTD